MVVGDIHQIEPVWNIPYSVDAGNLEACGLVDDRNHSERLQEVHNTGLTASMGSVMKAAVHNACHQLKGQDMRGFLLTEHRRCLPDIIGFCNELAYHDALTPMRSSDGTHLFRQFGYAHVRGICSLRGGSRFNLQEGEVIAGWLKSNRALIEKYYDKPISDAVGIITPFAAQFEKISKALIDVELPAFDFKVGTVHALQGAERDIVIFSPVYGFRERGSRYFFDQGVNMLNVAVSRAKDSFLVFGEMAIFDPTSRTPSACSLITCSRKRATNSPTSLCLLAREPISRLE